jgi:DNA-binding Xre family transcriptional regulator
MPMADWIKKYPKVQALLQRADETLEYEERLVSPLDYHNSLGARLQHIMVTKGVWGPDLAEQVGLSLMQLTLLKANCLPNVTRELVTALASALEVPVQVLAPEGEEIWWRDMDLQAEEAEAEEE